MSAKIAYFGYGSLVNLETLQTPYLSAHPARLKGWKRSWKARPKVAGSFAPIEGLAFLSVEPCEQTTIEGMVIVDHHASLPDLDEREALYDRTKLDHASVEFIEDSPLHPEQPLFVYVAQPEAGNAQARILRSYLDVVLRGFHGHFGEQGIERFIDTTANFDWPIHEDRHEPVYPRAISVHDHEVSLFERHLPARR
ncbi:MAG: gamma-glutamylcyclotransferase family protein [Rhizobiaceae bacterium]